MADSKTSPKPIDTALTDSIRAKLRGDYSLIGTWEDKFTFDGRPWPMWGDDHVRALLAESDYFRDMLSQLAHEVVTALEPGADPQRQVDLARKAYDWWQKLDSSASS